MDPTLILGLFNAVAPIVRQIIIDHQAKTGLMPTDAEMTAAFQSNITKYLAEGAAWTAAHPAQ